jgi:ABC-type transport system involved in Fe-S cluster assembly fused permease/ATPase subunit/phosphohistidine phosphatase SixA
LHEKVAGVAIVKGFARESAETTRFASHANKLLQRILNSVRFTATNEVAVGFVVHTAPVLVVWYGVHQILNGRLTVGALTQFLLYLGMFYSPLQRLSDLSVVLSNALAAIDRIFEYFDTQPHVAEHPNAVRIAECQGRIEFENVSFGYDGAAPILSDICLTILPGQSVAFVGPSGAGKSTLASLVPRFYDPTGGCIRLDGHDLRKVALDSLRANIGIVNQETILFSGTVLENLLLAAPNATQEQIVAALEAANALEFVQKLPDGLATEVGERGAVLSGGQKQRLAIARAFLKDPKILILDEATSALDSQAERRIQAATARLLKNRTSIVIAHRLSTVLRADQIVVLESGRIVDIGRHHELLARGGLYAQLYHEQFNYIKLAGLSAGFGCYHPAMNRDLDKMRRRPFFFPLVLPILLFVALVAAAAWLFDARATTVVFVVRHAETDPAPDPDPGLSVDGRERAARLARMLAQAQPVRGIDAIFASEYRRTHQTVTPLSETLALPVNLVPSATWSDLARRITRDHRGEYVLVSGNLNTVPQLVEALSGQKVTLREDEYDAMFIVFVPQISKKKVVRVRY